MGDLSYEMVKVGKKRVGHKEGGRVCLREKRAKILFIAISKCQKKSWHN